MLNNAKNNTIEIEDTNAHYISFGKGNKNLIVIPGLGDGFKTTKGIAIPFSFIYKKFANDYKVYVISRRNKLNEGFSTLDMANDIIYIMDKLNIEKTSIVGISQGGMIAQYLAINYPKRIEKLVLAVTLPKISNIAKENIEKWISFAANKDYRNLFIDNVEKFYTEKTLKKCRKLYNVAIKFSEPKEYDRFIVEANSCLNHNTYDKLNKINCPTLIIGAKKDKIVGVESSYILHDNIKDSKLYIYKRYGHAVYEEAKDFSDRVMKFLNK